MRKHVFVLTTTAAILACGAIAASAQAPSAQTPGTQQSPTTQPKAEDGDEDGFFRYHPRNDGNDGRRNDGTGPLAAQTTVEVATSLVQ